MTRLQTKLHLSIFAAMSVAPLAANAADLYHTSPAPSYAPPTAYVDTNSWTGFYAGINGGYGWNSGGNSFGYSDGGSGFINGTDQSAAPAPQGGFGGGQIGYNFQRGSFVFGVETDIQGAAIGDRVTGLTVNGNDFGSRESVDWFGTMRGRIGYAFGRFLIYGTGGVAYGGVREGAFVTNGSNAVSFGNNGTQIGWVAGGGVEFKITPSWSLKGEYQYIDLGSQTLNGIDTLGASATAAGPENSFSTVRLGLNYRFGGGPASKVMRKISCMFRTKPLRRSERRLPPRLPLSGGRLPRLRDTRR